MKKAINLMIAAASTSFFISCGGAEGDTPATDTTATTPADTTTEVVEDPAPVMDDTTMTMDSDTTMVDSTDMSMDAEPVLETETTDGGAEG